MRSASAANARSPTQIGCRIHFSSELVGVWKLRPTRGHWGGAIERCSGGLSRADSLGSSCHSLVRSHCPLSRPVLTGSCRCGDWTERSDHVHHHCVALGSQAGLLHAGMVVESQVLLLGDDGCVECGRRMRRLAHVDELRGDTVARIRRVCSECLSFH